MLGATPLLILLTLCSIRPNGTRPTYVYKLVFTRSLYPNLHTNFCVIPASPAVFSLLALHARTRKTLVEPGFVTE